MVCVCVAGMCVYAEIVSACSWCMCVSVCERVCVACMCARACMCWGRSARSPTQQPADPARNPLLGHHITQSHIQINQLVQAPQTGRNGAVETVGNGSNNDSKGTRGSLCGRFSGNRPTNFFKLSDATARVASVVGVWCTAMIHACLGC